MRTKILILTVLITMSACRAFDRVDTVGTLESENIAFATEAASIGTASFIERTTVAQTAVAAERTMVVIDGVNMQLIATLQRNITPTPALVNNQQVDATQQADFEGRRLFVKTGMSADINPEDGCVTVPQISFSVNEDRIYATAQAFNIEAGTPLSSRWYFEDELVYEFDFVTSENRDEWCFYFYIDPQTVEFRPGAWSVRLYADGFQLESPMGFTMEESMDTMTEP